MSGKEETTSKYTGTTSKFLSKSLKAPLTSNQTNSISLYQANLTEDSDGMTVTFKLWNFVFRLLYGFVIRDSKKIPNLYLMPIKLLVIKHEHIFWFILLLLF